MMSYRMVRGWLACALSIASVHGAHAQQPSPALTPAGQAILHDKLAADGRPLYGYDGPGEPMTFPLPICAFTGGLCGAVNHDGSVAVTPRYDWVGAFHDGRAAVRLEGLYGFVDETGHEIVPPHYRIVDDYKFGFAQIDVDGKSGLIDRDGRFVFEPRCGFIEAIAPDRFRVSESRRIGGSVAAEDFSGMRHEYPDSGGISLQSLWFTLGSTDVIDRNGQWIERAGLRLFDHDDPSLHLVLIDKRWGIQRAD